MHQAITASGATLGIVLATAFVAQAEPNRCSQLQTTVEISSCVQAALESRDRELRQAGGRRGKQRPPAASEGKNAVGAGGSHCATVPAPGAGPGPGYLMSFQNAAFRRHAMTVNTARNSSTHTPMRTRSLPDGSAIQ